MKSWVSLDEGMKKKSINPGYEIKVYEFRINHAVSLYQDIRVYCR